MPPEGAAAGSRFTAGSAAKRRRRGRLCRRGEAVQHATGWVFYCVKLPFANAENWLFKLPIYRARATKRASRPKGRRAVRCQVCGQRGKFTVEKIKHLITLCLSIASASLYVWCSGHNQQQCACAVWRGKVSGTWCATQPGHLLGFGGTINKALESSQQQVWKAFVENTHFQNDVKSAAGGTRRRGIR